jgi:hypothetical protein
MFYAWISRWEFVPSVGRRIRPVVPALKGNWGISLVEKDEGPRSTWEVLVDIMKRRKVSLDNLGDINMLIFLNRGQVKGKCRGKLWLPRLAGGLAPAPCATISNRKMVVVFTHLVQMKVKIERDQVPKFERVVAMLSRTKTFYSVFSSGTNTKL